MTRREPIRVPRRHTSVLSKFSLVTVLIAVAWVAPAPGLAQTGPSLEVEVGLEGMSVPQHPVEVAATISTPVLISGRIRVRGNQLAVSRPVEVPAGGSQTYQLVLPPLADGTRLTVELLDSRGEQLTSTPVVIRFPGRDTMVVGVVEDASLATSLGRVRALVTDRPVAAFLIPADTPLSKLAVLDYLVVGRTGAGFLDDALAWVEAGGRVVADAALVANRATTPTGVAGVGTVRVGAGELIAVESLDTRSAGDWLRILRPTPLVFGPSPEFGFDNRGLIQAASETGSGQVPTLPWLLGALLAFAFVVGPLNFLVLSRIGKRDWAWVTIPALATVAVVGFWVAGRQRIAGTHLSHASVIVEASDLRVRSAVVVAAGQPGERVIRFANASAVFPEQSLFGGAVSEMQLEDDTTVRVELDQLGFTGVGVMASPAVDLPRVRVVDGNVEVDNVSGLRFWGWGVVRTNSSRVGSSALDPGQTATLLIPGGRGDFGWSFIDNLMNQFQLWDDPTRSNALWPLNGVMVSEMQPGATYFVGLTDDYRPQVEVSGGASPMQGVTMVMVRVADADTQGERAAARVVATGFINWMDWGFEGVISTPEMTVRFDLPTGVDSVRFFDDGRFGMPPGSYEAWDWEQDEFVEIENRDQLGRRHISPDGQVYVRLRSDNEFGDHAMSPSSLSLEWSR